MFVQPSQLNNNPGYNGAPANQAPVQQRESPEHISTPAKLVFWQCPDGMLATRDVCKLFWCGLGWQPAGHSEGCSLSAAFPQISSACRQAC